MCDIPADDPKRVIFKICASLSNDPYFGHLENEKEDEEVFNKYHAMQQESSLGDESKDSGGSLGLDEIKLRFTKSELDAFIRKSDGISEDPLNRLPAKETLPWFLKSLLVDQVRSKESEEALARSRLGANAEEDASSIHTDGSEEEGSDEDEAEALSVERPDPSVLEIDKAGKYYFDKGIGRRGGVGNTGEGVDDGLHRRWSRTVWRQEMENLEAEYRLPVLILKKFKYIKENEPTRLGPGTYDVDYYQIQKEKKNRTTKGILTTCSSGFPKEKSGNENPGPSAYGDCHFAYERALDHHRHPGKVPLMQSGPCDVRGGTFKSLGSSLGPGQYQVIDGVYMNVLKPYFTLLLYFS